MRVQPRDRLDAFLGQPCEHARRETANLKFDDPGDSDISDCPTVYCVAHHDLQFFCYRQLYRRLLAPHASANLALKRVPTGLHRPDRRDFCVWGRPQR
jgi:hypothetical protein